MIAQQYAASNAVEKNGGNAASEHNATLFVAHTARAAPFDLALHLSVNVGFRVGAAMANAFQP